MLWLSGKSYKGSTDVTCSQLCSAGCDLLGWSRCCCADTAAPRNHRHGPCRTGRPQEVARRVGIPDPVREEADAGRFGQIESRLEEHTAKLADVPSTSQIVAAMEQLLTKTMSSLDDRLSAQARSIDVLKTTVSQTDSLLERVLESLDTLQSYSDPSELAEDPILSRPAVWKLRSVSPHFNPGLP